MSHHVRQPTRVLPVTQTSHEKETVDAGPSQSHLSIWGLRDGYPAPDKIHGAHYEMSLLHNDSTLGNGISNLKLLKKWILSEKHNTEILKICLKYFILNKN